MPYSDLLSLHHMAVALGQGKGENWMGKKGAYEIFHWTDIISKSWIYQEKLEELGVKCLIKISEVGLCWEYFGLLLDFSFARYKQIGVWECMEEETRKVMEIKRKKSSHCSRERTFGERKR